MPPSSPVRRATIRSCSPATKSVASSCRWPVLGLRQQENLFVDDQGQWLARSYLPAHIRRHPFCITEIPDAQGRAPQRLVCVEQQALRADAPPLFTKAGEPTPAWETVQRLIEAIEAAQQQTRVLCKRLEALGLLTPFDALAMPRGGQRMRLQGLYRVDEEKLSAVPGKDLRMMLRKSELKWTYAHLLSLENFGKLMDLAVQRDAAKRQS